MSLITKSACMLFIAAVIWQYFIKSHDAAEPTRESTKSIEAVKSLEDHSKIFNTKEIIQVADGVYVAIGYAIANMIMIEGDDGIIIVDTTENPEIALEIFAEFRKITSKPLKGIIITHFHADHVNGAVALMKLNSEQKINVYMHSNAQVELRRFISTSELNFARGARQFGIFLEKGREKINAGIGPGLKLDRDFAYSVPDVTHSYVTEETFTLAGITFQLIHTPGETDDQTTVWIQSKRLVLPADNIYEAFPNLYAIRGSPPRSCRQWFESLDKVRDLRAQYMIPSHTRPVVGENEIYDIITHYRDAIQFVYDQTVRYLNKGMSSDDIVERVRLPGSLANHPYLQEFYGTVAWSVRGVYDSFLGWFDGEPENLDHLPKLKRAKKWQELLGGGPQAIETMMDHLQKTLTSASNHFKSSGSFIMDDLRWALELASYTYELCKEIGGQMLEKAKKHKIEALRLLASSTMNANARNYYLTFAKELETGLSLKPSIVSKKNAVTSTLKIDEIMCFFPLRFKAEDCDDKMVLVIVISFTDLNQSYSYIVRHCVVEYRPNTSLEEFDGKLSTTSTYWRQMIVGDVSLVAGFTSGDFTIDGSLLSFKRFMDLIEKNIS